MAKMTLFKLREAAAILNQELMHKPVKARVSYQVAVAFNPINVRMEALEATTVALKAQVEANEISEAEAEAQYAELLNEEVEIEIESKVRVKDLEDLELQPSLFSLASFLFDPE